MAEETYLGEFELMILLAVLRLGDDAYGVPVRREIERRTRRRVSRGAVYITLDRLERKGYLESWQTDPTPERGGRAKRCYRVSRVGLRAVRNAHRALEKMWDGLEPVIGKV